MAQVAAHREQFKERGTEVVLISFEGRKFADPWKREMDVPFPMLIDRQREAYNAFGLERSFWHSWGLKNLWYYFKALMQGREIASATYDTTQLGGDFIVDGDGILQHVYYSENPTDRPAVEQLLAVMCKNRDLETQEREKTMKPMLTRPMTRFVLLLFWLLCLSLLAACGGGEPEITPTPSPSALQMEIEEAIAQFEAQGIDDYTVRVTFRRSNWNPQILDLEVVDGEATIVDQDCIPGRNCYIRPDLDAADFTLDSIFTVVREQAALNGVTQVTYHDTYGFPRIVATSEGNYEISNFQPQE